MIWCALIGSLPSPQGVGAVSGSGNLFVDCVHGYSSGFEERSAWFIRLFGLVFAVVYRLCLDRYGRPWLGALYVRGAWRPSVSDRPIRHHDVVRRPKSFGVANLSRLFRF